MIRVLQRDKGGGQGVLKTFVLLKCRLYNAAALYCIYYVEQCSSSCKMYAVQETAAKRRRPELDIAVVCACAAVEPGWLGATTHAPISCTTLRGRKCGANLSAAGHTVSISIAVLYQLVTMLWSALQNDSCSFNWSCYMKQGRFNCCPWQYKSCPCGTLRATANEQK